jgi:hypothetical protein
MRAVVVMLAAFAPALLSASPTAQIQDKPDFSGRWKLSGTTVPGSDFPPSLIVRQSIARTNVRGDAIEPYFKDVSVEREFPGGTRAETYLIGVVGGRVSGVDTRAGTTPQAGFQTTYAVRWEGGRLVYESGRYEGPVRAAQSVAELRAGPYSERVEVWELGSDGLLTISITTRGSGVETTTKSATYVRN